MPDKPTQMIVTAQPEASEAGARVLMAGGADPGHDGVALGV